MMRTALKNMNETKDQDDNPRHGHRQRLKQRFIKGGRTALSDYELLELFLFSVVPRRDTKPLAKLLLKRFGTISEMIAAKEEDLLNVAGVGEAIVQHFSICAAVMQQVAEEKFERRITLSNTSELRNYCRQLLVHQDIENFWVLFLNKKVQLIKSEKMQQGTITQTPVFPREIIKRAVQLSASGIILVHNHPSGDPSPSQNDVTMTHKIIEMANTMDIIVHDHFIIARDGDCSLKALRLFPSKNKKL